MSNKNQFKRMYKRIEKELPREMNYMLNNLANLTTPLVPLDTGKLRTSSVKQIEQRENGIKGRLWYTATAPNGYDYADIQHENLNFNHPRGGQAKYLYESYRLNRNTLLKTFGNRVMNGAKK